MLIEYVVKSYLSKQPIFTKTCENQSVSNSNEKNVYLETKTDLSRPHPFLKKIYEVYETDED